MSDREDLAAAINAVSGMNISPHYRESTVVGDGWVFRGKMTKEDFGYLNEWKISVVGPQNMTAMDQWMEAKFLSIMTALDRELYDLSITPTEIPMSGTDNKLLGILIRGTREN